MILDVDAILTRAAREKKAAKPLPQIVIRQEQKPLHQKSPAQSPTKHQAPSIKPQIELVQSLWREFGALKNERNKLSTEISIMVENGATQDELRRQYEKIEGFRPQLQDLYDKIEYAERNGYLPVEEPEDPETLWSLKVKRDSLIDERYKLRRKLDMKAAKNPLKYVDWELRLAQADIEYQDAVEKIKKMEGKA